MVIEDDVGYVLTGIVSGDATTGTVTSI